jgi:hypothetical protein
MALYDYMIQGTEYLVLVCLEVSPIMLGSSFLYKDFVGDAIWPCLTTEWRLKISMLWDE